MTDQLIEVLVINHIIPKQLESYKPKEYTELSVAEIVAAIFGDYLKVDNDRLMLYMVDEGGWVPARGEALITVFLLYTREKMFEEAKRTQVYISDTVALNEANRFYCFALSTGNNWRLDKIKHCLKEAVERAEFQN